MRWEFGNARREDVAVGVTNGRLSDVVFRRKAVFGPRSRRIVSRVRDVSVASSGEVGSGLDEEGVQRMLKGGDRTVGVGEGGLEMGEDLGLGWPALGCGGRVGRWILARQCGANLALGQDEAFPDAIAGAVTEMADGGVEGREDTAGEGKRQEPQEGAGGEAEATDLVGAPDAEGASAAASRIAVAAKDTSRAKGWLLRGTVVEAAQTAMAIQVAEKLAMRTRRQLEPLGKRRPFLVVAIKLW